MLTIRDKIKESQIMTRFRCLVVLSAIGVLIGGFAGSSRSQRTDRSEDADRASIKGTWTGIYWKRWTGLVLRP